MLAHLSFYKRFFKSISWPFQLLSLISLSIGLYLIAKGIVHNLLFSFDQARDALEAYSIWHGHHLKILGPATDINGVFHGVLWYYLLAFAYAVHNQPEFVAIFLSILLGISAIFVAILSYRLFKDSYITLISFLLYVFSPLFLISTHWISNPILSFIATPFILFFLREYITKQRAMSLFLVGLSIGILIQGEFGFAIMLLCLPIYWYVFQIPLRVKHLLAFIVGLAIALSTFILGEVKFHFQGIFGVLHYFQHAGRGHLSIENIVVNYLQRNAKFFSVASLPFHQVIVLFILGICCYFLSKQLSGNKKQPILFLVIWLAGLFLFQFFDSGISTSYFLFYPFLPAATILIAFILNAVCKKKYILFVIVSLLIFLQLNITFTYLKNNFVIFTLQQQATLPEEKQIITYTYKAANKEPFTINAITNPLYTNTTWAYLYQQYGVSTYGYLPYWGGRGEPAALGMLPQKQFATNIRFLIFEPQDGIPDVFREKITFEEDKISDILEVRRFGRFVVQKRVFHLHKIAPQPPEMLSHSPILYE